MITKGSFIVLNKLVFLVNYSQGKGCSTVPTVNMENWPISTPLAGNETNENQDCKENQSKWEHCQKTKSV